MSTREQESEIRELASLVDSRLKEIYGERMAFFLNISYFEDSVNGATVADYVANCSRESAIEWMLETIERFKGNEVIPATEGKA